MIKPWLFEFFASFGGEDADPAGQERFDPRQCAADYQWYLARWIAAEAAGFEGIFFSEHHFVAGRNSPSPNLLIAAVAMRTRRLRLGAMGNVAPLYEPWRLAEEYAMLDHLTAGRLEIGLSSGIGPKEFEAIGLAAEEVRPRFAETLDIVEAALTTPRFSHHGLFWHLDNLAISPRPLQQPMPPRWITGMSAATAVMAAQRGYKFCTGFITVAQATAIFERYRAAARAAGHPADSSQLALRRQVLIADDDGAAHAAAHEATLKMRARMAGPPPSVGAPPPAATGAASVAPDAPKPHAGGPIISEDESIAGSPDSVAEQIIDQCRRTGAGHMLAYPFGVLTRGQVERSDALWPRVIAQLRRARVSP